MPRAGGPEYPTPQATGAYDRGVRSSLAQKIRPAVDFPDRCVARRLKEMLRFSLATLAVGIVWVLREDSGPLVIGKITGYVPLVSTQWQKSLLRCRAPRSRPSL